MINNFKDSIVDNLELEKDERIEKIIKVRNLTGIKIITIASMMMGTLGKSNDYALFDKLCFTNKRILIDRLNHSDDVLITKEFKKEDVEAIYFTNKIVKVKDNKDGTPKIKIRYSFLDMFCLFYSTFALILFISTLGTTEPPYDLIKGGLFTLIYLIARIPYIKYGRTIQIVMKNKEKFDFLIDEKSYNDTESFFKNFESTAVY